MARADSLTCPNCGAEVKQYRNPFPTVDIVIEQENEIVLVLRKNPPHGWALPGGFIDYGESAEQAAVREAKEETGLDVVLTGLLGVYSDPDRDPRFHTITVVFTATATGTPHAADDAADLGLFPEGGIPAAMAFDHGKIVRDYFRRRQGDRPGERNRPEGG